MSIFNELSELVIKGNIAGCKAKVQEAVDAGEDPTAILNEGLMPGINEIGDRFAKGQIFVPNVLLSAKAMNAGVEVIQPLLAGKGDTTIGTAVVATVKGDLHDIGKNLVCLMVESAGFEVEDLGVDVPAERFVEAAADPNVKIVGVSALLTTTMPAMKATVEALNAAPNRANFKVMVGGAPITQAFAEEIGADAYTTDAATCASVAKKFVVG